MLKIATIITIAFCLSLASALSFSGNGSGTESDPYQITTVEQLQEMNDDLSAHYILMNDIDASDTRNWNVGDHDNNAATADVAMGFEPVGGTAHIEGFQGTLDGMGFEIKRLYINTPRNSYGSGLFSHIYNVDVIRNLRISEAEIKAGDYVGILAGEAFCNKNNSTTVENCTVDGKVTGNDELGGLIGSVYSGGGTIKIANCSSSVEITCSWYGGGLIGYSKGSVIQIIDSESSSFVKGKNHIGGFVGTNSRSIISNCASYGSVFGNEDVGGFVGTNKGIISDCDSFGDVSAEEKHGGGFCGCNGISLNSIKIDIIKIYHCRSFGDVISDKFDGLSIGGFCGLNIAVDSVVAIIEECFCEGNAIGYESIGGFCGVNDADFNEGDAYIINCYSTGKAEGYYYTAGFCGELLCFLHKQISEIRNCYSIGSVGNNYSGFLSRSHGGAGRKITNCYYDINKTDATSSVGGTPKTTAEMMMQSTFENWDFDNIWCIVEGQTYPQLQHFVDCDTLVSVPEIIYEGNINIFPIPVSDIIKIYSDVKIIRNVRIINILGNIVFQIDVNGKSIEIPFEGFPAGCYLVQVMSENKLLNKYIIKR